MNATDDTGARAAPGRTAPVLAFLARAYLFIAALAGAAHWAPALNAGYLLALAVVLAVPAALALWHRAVVRSLLSLHQFQPGRALHWIGSRLVLRKILGALLALLVAYSSMLHASFFGPRDWLLLALMPVVFAAARLALEARLRPHFSGAVYASHTALRLAGWAVARCGLLWWMVVASSGPRSKNAISTGLVASVKSNTDTPPWYHACALMSRPGTGISEPLCATQFSVSVCGAGSL